MDGGALLVGIENQGVWLWAVRDDSDNPMVWERENESGQPWTETGSIWMSFCGTSPGVGHRQ